MAAPPAKAWAKVQYTQTSLGSGTNPQGQAFPGGLDLTTPSLRLPPGALRDALNFEVAPFGGYTRVEGYERFDGRFSPSEATYTIVQYVEGQVNANEFVLDQSILDGPDVLGPVTVGFAGVGQLVTQAVTGATGLIIAAVQSPVSYLVLTQVSGTFDNINLLTTSIP